MENNYYTPQIEEFYSGFEYEYLSKGPIIEWIKSSEFSNDYDYEDNPHYAVMKGIEATTIRVKYLDQSDIEELGFVNDGLTEDNWARKGYFKHTEGYSLRLEHTPNVHVCCISLHGNEGFIMDVFKGIVKNKSVLSQLLEIIPSHI